MAWPVSGSTRPVSALQPVHWPIPSRPRLVAARGPSTIDHSARTRPAAPTPLQLGRGGDGLGNVYEVSIVLGSGEMSGRLVRPSTMPPNPSPKANDRCSVACQVGSIVPANLRPDSPPAADALAY